MSATLVILLLHSQNHEPCEGAQLTEFTQVLDNQNWFANEFSRFEAFASIENQIGMPVAMVRYAKEMKSFALGRTALIVRH